MPDSCDQDKKNIEALRKHNLTSVTTDKTQGKKENFKLHNVIRLLRYTCSTGQQIGKKTVSIVNLTLQISLKLELFHTDVNFFIIVTMAAVNQIPSHK